MYKSSAIFSAVQPLRTVVPWHNIMFYSRSIVTMLVTLLYIMSGVALNDITVPWVLYMSSFALGGPDVGIDKVIIMKMKCCYCPKY